MSLVCLRSAVMSAGPTRQESEGEWTSRCAVASSPTLSTPRSAPVEPGALLPGSRRKQKRKWSPARCVRHPRRFLSTLIKLRWRKSARSWPRSHFPLPQRPSAPTGRGPLRVYPDDVQRRHQQAGPGGSRPAEGRVAAHGLQESPAPSYRTLLLRRSQGNVEEGVVVCRSSGLAGGWCKGLVLSASKQRLASWSGTTAEWSVAGLRSPLGRARPEPMMGGRL